MRFLFACGGTGGHINPALAIAGCLRERDGKAKFLFVGAGREMEKRLIPAAGYGLVNIEMRGLKRGIAPNDMLHNIKMLRSLATAGTKAGEILRRFSPDAVIGTGGYICYPVLKKAAQMGIPTFIHESNAEPGLTTKLLSTKVDKVMVPFPGLEDIYRRRERVIFAGTPVRQGFDAADKDSETPRDGAKPLVLSFWGSLGAERMNEMTAGFIKRNIDSGEFAHIHAAGKPGGVAEMINRLKRIGAPDALPPDIEIRDYIDDMPRVMRRADLVICRAGGSTVAELTAMGKAAVLVPSPYVSNNEQEKNAEQLRKAGGAIVLDERACTSETLYNTAAEILRGKEVLAAMASASAAIGVPRAASKIAELVLDIIKEKEKGDDSEKTQT